MEQIAKISNAAQGIPGHDSDDCPEPKELLDLRIMRMGYLERRNLVNHILECPICRAGHCLARKILN